MGKNQKSRWRRAGLFVCLVFTLLSCEGTIDGGERGEEEEPEESETPEVGECREPSLAVYTGLRPSCVGCHNEGANYPAFASFEAFELLLANDPRFVTPGDVDGSRLWALLNGTAGGSLSQMPPGTLSFAELESAGQTSIALPQIHQWITEFEVCDTDATPTPIPLASRLMADQLRAALEMGLGLEQSDVLGRFQIIAPHEDRSANHAVWFALGGGDLPRGSPSQRPSGAEFMQQWIPLAQHWCSVSVDESSALFTEATNQTSSEDTEAARANIRAMFRRLIGDEPTEADVSRLFEEVFIPVESRGGTRPAWVAVCASLLRDPLFLTY